jgi:hypothetical protein
MVKKRSGRSESIAEEGVWNIGPVLQGLTSSILSRIVAAISGFGNTFNDVDRSPNGMPVKRGYATRWIGHLNHNKFRIIAGEWKTFENLTRDTRKPGLMGSCAVTPVVEVQAQSQAAQGRDLSTLAPLRALRCFQDLKAERVPSPFQHHEVNVRSAVSTIPTIGARQRSSAGGFLY